MPTSTVWIVFDLGVRGDYEQLYSWLDSHDAVECGDSVACFKYQHSGPLLDNLTDDLKSAIEVDKRTRIYAIYRDRRTNKNKGKFIFGKRRAPPWTGCSPSKSDVADVED